MRIPCGKYGFSQPLGPNLQRLAVQGSDWLASRFVRSRWIGHVGDSRSRWLKAKSPPTMPAIPIKVATIGATHP